MGRSLQRGLESPGIDCVQLRVGSLTFNGSVVVRGVGILYDNQKLFVTDTLTYTATVYGIENQAVNWSVVEAGGGTITASGLYTPPASVGVYHVEAVSVTDPSLFSIVTVNIVPALEIQPSRIMLGKSGSRIFSALSKYSEVPDATFAIQEGAAGGTIGGILVGPQPGHTCTIYHAPAASGIFHVVASKGGDTATATVSVTTPGFYVIDQIFPFISYAGAVLQDGRVLLTGGYVPLVTPDGIPLSDFGQVFDFATQTFSPPVAMSSARAGHSAVTLSNGKVLISGGDQGTTFGPLDTTDLFDPASGQFSPGGQLTTKRYLHTSVLLKDGRVLLLGNYQDNIPGPLNTAELYDPITNHFSRTGDLHSSRALPAAVLLGDGRVLVVGGDYSNSAEIYDPATAQFSFTGNMQSRRYRAATALLLPDGRVIVFGGVVTGDQGQVEIYDPLTGTFQPTAPLPTGNADSGTLLPGGRVLILSFDHSWIFDPLSTTYTEVGTMAANHGYRPFLMKDCSVLVFGDSGCNVDTEVFRELQ